MPTSFAVKTTVFEGPLELLLDLIEKRKLLINDISLASVTDEYIAYVRELQEDHTHHTAQFVLVAATLLLIKSKSLLPTLDLTEEETQNVTDLESRLQLYQIFRNAGVELASHFDTTPLFERTYVPDTTPLFTTDSRTTTESLCGALFEVIQRFPKPIFRPHVAVKKIVSLEEMIHRVQERVEKQFKLSFKEFINSKEPAHVIIGFLAILELVKQGTILAEQEKHFHDITLERGAIDTPSYR